VVDWIKYEWFKINVNDVDGLTLRHFWQNALKLIGIYRTCIGQFVAASAAGSGLFRKMARNLIQVFNEASLSDGHGSGLSLKLR